MSPEASPDEMSRFKRARVAKARALRAVAVCC